MKASVLSSLVHSTAFSLYPTSTRSSYLHSRCLRFFVRSVPFSPKPNTRHPDLFKSRNSSLLVLRNCSSITAKPSSELRKKNPTHSEPDEKLRALRELFSKPGIGIDAYIIPSQDAHQSELIAECYMRRTYISGFTGSAGTAVVTKDKAALWTDGRYFLQAEKQLSSSWILMRAGNYGVPNTSEWLNDVLAPGCRIGIDPFVFSSDAAEELKEAISNKNHELVYLHNSNLVDEIWGESRPRPPNKPIRVHDLRYAGESVQSKLYSLRSELNDAGCSAIVISMLDEVAWLLNLRGNDVPNSPVVYAFLIVETHGARLYIDVSKVTKEVMDHLQNAGIVLRPYESIISDVESLALQGERLWLDVSSVNAAIVNTYKSACNRYFGSLDSRADCNSQTSNVSSLYNYSPVSLAKAVKNHAELEGMRNSHIRDAAALAQFWAWLEEEIHNGAALTEVDVADKLLKFRSEQDGFMDTSFDTISASGGNGAIIHYKPEPGSCSIVDADKLFLLDSGAQYIDGTTDITRTVHFCQPTAWQKECFTRVLQSQSIESCQALPASWYGFNVLSEIDFSVTTPMDLGCNNQGHIALDQAIFPENTPGFVLDAFARSSLWKVGLDYRHGTGHGVGAALNVHEGPQSISFRFGNMTPLQKGMIVSNEPGYYEDHAFGIRIENLLYVKEVNTPNRFGGKGYLGFEKLTFVPIQNKLVDKSLLSVSEINWLNEYHGQVWEKVSPLLSSSASEWLWNNTRPLL